MIVHQNSWGDQIDDFVDTMMKIEIVLEIGTGMTWQFTTTATTTAQLLPRRVHV
jgi:hypothetical protein